MKLDIEQVFVKKGSTDSLFNQTQQAKNAKSGIPNSWKEAAVDELNNDKVWKSQLDEMNPAKAKYTRRYSSDSALDAIKEIMGRDAGRLSREEFGVRNFQMLHLKQVIPQIPLIDGQ